MTEVTFVQDYESIVAAIEKYNRGAAQADSSIMRPSFEDQATIFNVDGEGKLSGGSIQILFDAVDNDLPKSPDARAAIVRVDIVGTAASARIDTDNLAGGRFTDFFHLLKVEGQWKVLSKIYHAHG